MNRTFRLALLSICMAQPLLSSNTAAAEDKLARDTSLLNAMTIEELMDVNITTASKRWKTAFETASLVHVITAEDIARSGATNLPEALRLAPGLNVSRVDLNHYIVQGNTTNDYFTDKLLVLIDGRPLQSSTFSAVWWPAQMHPLEEIQRIEVIRGPGSALWGANAMNGVINIITRKAGALDGASVVAAKGKYETGFGTASLGQRLSDAFAWRAYVTAREADGARFVSGERGDNPRDTRYQNNALSGKQAGFRADWENEASRTSLHGDVYDVSAFSEGASFFSAGFSTAHFVHNDAYSGHNLVWNHERELSGDLLAKAQVFYDRNKVDLIFFGDDVETADAEAQVDYSGLGGHTFSFGGNYRVINDRFTGTVALDKPNDAVNQYGAFLQDEMQGFGGRLKVILGAKVERNSFTGWEVQPNAKASWMQGDWMMWTSAAKSSRLPNTVNNNMSWVVDSLESAPDGAPYDYPVLGVIRGSGGAAPEEVISYELGARAKPDERISVDSAIFYNEYRNGLGLVANFDDAYFVPASGDSVDHYEYDINYKNVFDGSSYGGTISVNSQPAVWARVFAAYTYTRVISRLNESIPLSNFHDYSSYISGSTPLYTIKTGVRTDLPGGVQFDLIGFYTEAQPDVNVFSNFRLDVRLAYKPSRKSEISFVGRNVLKEEQMEWFSPWTYDNAWVNRDFYIKLKLDF